MRYIIEITQIAEQMKDVEIEADSREEALKKAYGIAPELNWNIPDYDYSVRIYKTL